MSQLPEILEIMDQSVHMFDNITNTLQNIDSNKTSLAQSIKTHELGIHKSISALKHLVNSNKSEVADINPDFFKHVDMSQTLDYLVNLHLRSTGDIPHKNEEINRDLQKKFSIIRTYDFDELAHVQGNKLHHIMFEIMLTKMVKLGRIDEIREAVNKVDCPMVAKKVAGKIVHGTEQSLTNELITLEGEFLSAFWEDYPEIYPSNLLELSKAANLVLPQFVKYQNLVEWDGQSNLPFETVLPENMVHHSVFICPVTKEQFYNNSNLVLLSCNHLVSSAAVQELEANNQLRCPCCTKEIDYETLQSVKLYI